MEQVSKIPSSGPVTQNITIQISYDLSTPPPSEDEYKQSSDPRTIERRTRNKLAAARCRKRRMDLTKDLMIQVMGLKQKTHLLYNEMSILRAEKSKLIMILNEHRAYCRLNRQPMKKMEPAFVPAEETKALNLTKKLSEDEPKTKAAEILYNFGCLIDESGSMPK